MKKLKVEVGKVYGVLLQSGYRGHDLKIERYDEAKKVYVAENGLEARADGVVVGKYWGCQLIEA